MRKNSWCGSSNLITQAKKPHDGYTMLPYEIFSFIAFSFVAFATDTVFCGTGPVLYYGVYIRFE